MHLVDHWQRPAADDINPDALEYLLGQKKPPTKTPWVEMSAGNESVVRITPEYIRLQTKVEVLRGALELTSEQLYEAHHKIGMFSAELARRDVLLKEMSDYRAKAALAIIFERQNEIMRSRISELEEVIVQLCRSTRDAYNDKAAAVNQSEAAEGYASGSQLNADTYVVKNSKFVFPVLLLNAALVLGFAITVLVTLLH